MTQWGKRSSLSHFYHSVHLSQTNACSTSHSKWLIYSMNFRVPYRPNYSCTVLFENNSIIAFTSFCIYNLALFLWRNINLFTLDSAEHYNLNNFKNIKALNKNYCITSFSTIMAVTLLLLLVQSKWNAAL